MTYDFDELIDRKGTSAVKWDASAEETMLPMWVADMDFKTAPPIVEALAKRVAHGIFGYTLLPDTFFEAIVNWWHKRHGFSIQKEWIIPTTGIIPALSALIRSFTEPGDQVLLLSPAYNHFYESIGSGSCQVIESELIYSDGRYTIDFDDVEEKAQQESTKIMIICNPHNPTGRVWNREELSKLTDICRKHGLIIVSDEIHSDLIHTGFRHIPTAAVAGPESVITLSSPSKSFNLAGLQVGYLFTANTGYRERIEATFRMQDTNMFSPFAVEGLQAAYNEGEPWLEALKVYLYNNYLYLREVFKTKLPALSVLPLEATYLVWADCRSLPISTTELSAALLEQEKLWINAGSMYGTGGEGFIRINIACPRPLLEEGLDRLVRGVSGRQKS
ncbi:MalY/PatB family protein [Pedobacter deserti]|uniref:MalY/PatB family protein n=1 Tax=Pedobacter deserti TaxID=2817382 RepID=UPI00210BEE14|nr:MalY/PatB family protein [Pedobacter sp. SYSU D00382]